MKTLTFQLNVSFSEPVTDVETVMENLLQAIEYGVKEHGVAPEGEDALTTRVELVYEDEHEEMRTEAEFF